MIGSPEPGSNPALASQQARRVRWKRYVRDRASNRLLESSLTNFCPKYRQPCAYEIGRFPRGWHLREARPACWHWRDCITVEKLLQRVRDHS